MTQTRPDDRSLGQLVADATAQVQTLVKAEIALAKAELAHDAKKAGIGAGLFGGAGFFAYIALLFLSVAAGFGLHALGLGYGWSFLIVGGAYLLLAAILGLAGKAHLDKMTKAARTKRTIQDDVEWAKSLKTQLASPPEQEQLPPTDGRPAVEAPKQ
ncbi:MAG: phage holin family protein [Streptosporangiales bacterium]|nr:phage holin family protein [Streptosporangiales bacterium]